MFISNSTPKRKSPYSLIDPIGRKLLFRDIWKYRSLYLFMVLPCFALIFIFRYIPIYGIQLAFKEFSLKGIQASEWIGLDNFARFAIEPEFWRALRNTLIISFLKIGIGFPYPIVLALMINEVYLKKFKRVLQTIYTFPHFLSWVVVVGLMINLLGDTGAVKRIFMEFNPYFIDNWNVLYSKSIFRLLLVLTDIWKEGGWGTIIYLAAIASIDPSMYEAATLDGCNRIQRIIYVTLPHIKDIIVVMFILRVGGVMDGNFDQVFNLYSSPVYEQGDVLDTYIYRITFQSNVAMDYGFSTAVGLFKSVVNFGLVLLASTGSRLMGGSSIF